MTLSPERKAEIEKLAEAYSYGQMSNSNPLMRESCRIDYRAGAERYAEMFEVWKEQARQNAACADRIQAQLEIALEHKRLLFAENGRLLEEKESGQWDLNCQEIEDFKTQLGKSLEINAKTYQKLVQFEAVTKERDALRLLERDANRKLSKSAEREKVMRDALQRVMCIRQFDDLSNLDRVEFVRKYAEEALRKVEEIK